jgi:hypothetical protein
MTVRISLLLTLVGGAAAAAFSATVAKGLLAGSITGILAFWIMAIRIEKLAMIRGDKVTWMKLPGAFLGLGLYAATLAWAYSLDPHSLRGLIAAFGGLMIVRFVQAGLGLTGLDLKKAERESGTDGPNR